MNFKLRARVYVATMRAHAIIYCDIFRLKSLIHGAATQNEVKADDSCCGIFAKRGEKPERLLI